MNYYGTSQNPLNPEKNSFLALCESCAMSQLQELWPDRSHGSPLHGLPGALWQYQGDQSRRLRWKGVSLFSQIQITHLFLGKLNVTQVSSFPSGKKKKKKSSLLALHPKWGGQCRFHDHVGEAQKRNYHRWDILSSRGSSKIRMIPGTVLASGVTFHQFCFKIRKN